MGMLPVKSTKSRYFGEDRPVEKVGIGNPDPETKNFNATKGTRIETNGLFEAAEHFYHATFEIDEKCPTYSLIPVKNVLELKALDSFCLLQSYTLLKIGVMAIEPMTCCINSFNNKIGLIEISPTDTFYATIQIRQLMK